MGKKNSSSIFLQNLKLDEVLQEITSLDPNKAMSHDKIPPKVIKWAAELLSPILLVLYNKCIKLGYYPEKMKLGKVSPIHKKGDKNDNDNYRPITVLSQFNRIFE